MVGNFDGVHTGHRWVLEHGVEAAAAAGLDPIVLTFHPHPSEVLGRGTLPVLTPIERKVALMARLSPRLAVVVEPFTRWFTVHPDDDSDLVDTLWDLPAWQARAMELRRSMAVLERRLVAGDTDALAPGWLLSAAVLRHFNADPMLPRELLGRKWPGDALRADYDRYDATYKSLLGEWLGLGRDGEADRPRGGKAGTNGR